MFERFTDRARKVMQLANQEAQRFNHEYIGTEHILLGLVKEGSGLAAGVFKALDIDLRKVRLEVEKIVQITPGAIVMGKLPQTPRARKVIEHAIDEARKLNDRHVGTEHLLLGLVREEPGVGAQILLNLGLDLQRLRAVILDYRKGGPWLQPRPSVAGRWLGRSPATDLRPARSPFAEQEGRLQALESQLLNVRVVLSILVGIVAGAVLGGEPGAFAGLLLGTLVGIVGGRGLGALVGAVPGALLVATYLPGPGWGLIGLIGGAVLGACLGDVGRPLRLGRKKAQDCAGAGAGVSLYFNHWVRRLLRLADQAADDFHHEYIGTEHLLLGLLQEDSGRAAGILQNLGIDPRRVLLEVRRRLVSGPDRVVFERRPQTSRAAQALEYALAEAWQLEHDYIGPEHVLLGLLREREGTAGDVLTSLGVKLEDVRREALAPRGRRAPRDQAEPRPWPAEVRRALAELDAQLAELTRQKEAAVAASDFERAAALRDQADRLRKQREQIIRDAAEREPGVE